MANTFKNAIKPNVTTTGSDYDTLYTAPSGTTSIILGLALANKTTSSKAEGICSVPAHANFLDGFRVKQAPEQLTHGLR